MRRENDTNEWLVVVANFTPNTHGSYKVGVPVKDFIKKYLIQMALDTEAVTKEIWEVKKL